MKELFKNGRGPRLLLAILGVVLGVVLMLAGGIGGGSERKDISADAEAEAAEAYRLRVEERVRALCLSVDGVGEVKVMVTLLGGYRYCYAEDERGECLTVGSGSSERAVVREVLAPEIAGVGIVCEGAGSAAVRETVVELVCSSLGIGANRVAVTVGK